MPSTTYIVWLRTKTSIRIRPRRSVPHNSTIIHRHCHSLLVLIYHHLFCPRINHRPILYHHCGHHRHYEGSRLLYRRTITTNHQRNSKCRIRGAKRLRRKTTVRCHCSDHLAIKVIPNPPPPHPCHLSNKRYIDTPHFIYIVKCLVSILFFCGFVGNAPSTRQFFNNNVIEFIWPRNIGTAKMQTLHLILNNWNKEKRNETKAYYKHIKLYKESLNFRDL